MDGSELVEERVRRLQVAPLRADLPPQPRSATGERLGATVCQQVASVKQSAAPPPSSPGRTAACPLQSAAGPVSAKTLASPPTTTACPPPSAPGTVLVESPASSPPRAPALSLVKPPATPPQRAPARRQPSPSPAPTSWLLLDRFVHCSRRQRGVFQGDATTSDIADDCVGRRIRVSLRVADPPLVSRLYLHWAPRPDIEKLLGHYVIAAHRHSILFRVTVPFEDSVWWHNRYCFPIDYFVYSAASTSTSSSLPSLTRLPPCFDYKRVFNELEDKWLKPYRRQHQRCMVDEDMILFCHGDDGEFTVAELTYCSQNVVELAVLHHSPRSSVIPMQWRVKKLQAFPGMTSSSSFWTTDTTFPIGGYLCWVDNYHGMLLVDVLLANSGCESSPSQQQLRFIPLPKLALKSSRPYKDPGSPDPFRHVCVTDADAGIVKLVCIFTKYSQSTFTIISWSLNIHRGSWIKDCSTIIEDSEFFCLFDAAQSNLPRVTPNFPVVSLADPDIIYFLLKEYDEGEYTYWVIEVNMREKVLQSTALYIGTEEEEGYHPKNPCWHFYGQYFVPSRFSSYLGQDDLKSRELSILMEENAKQRRAMQKEARLEDSLTQERLNQCCQENPLTHERANQCRQAKGKEAQSKKLLTRKAKQRKGKGSRHN